MVRGKIFYDNVIRTRDEWEKSIDFLNKGSQNIVFPELTELPYFNSVQSHYFAILHNNPNEIRLSIRNQLGKKIDQWSSIIWDAVLDSGKNCEFYRIDILQRLEIYRNEIYCRQNSWIKVNDLHSKGLTAISNLIKKMESGEFS